MRSHLHPGDLWDGLWRVKKSRSKKSYPQGLVDNYRETTGNTIGLCFNVPANPASIYPRITFHTQGYTQRSNCMKTTEKRSISAAKPVGELLPKKLGERTKPKPLSRVQKRGIEASTAIALDLPDQIGYQHTVLCQTSMPYRDPGKAVREWEREQGAVSLRLEAGHAQHPETKGMGTARSPLWPQVPASTGALKRRSAQDGVPRRQDRGKPHSLCPPHSGPHQTQKGRP